MERPVYSIVIPVFNQLAYTRKCLDGLRYAGIADSNIVVVNNGSSDGTAEFLASQPGIRTIRNAENRGCAVAWNQGVRVAQSTWTVLLNNDVVVAPRWLEGLIEFADAEAFDVVSPAMREGQLDYDLPAFAEMFVEQMSSVCRRGAASGVCFMVHHRVFDRIGCFEETLGLAGYEDDDFFRRARRAGFRLATTGRAFLHHFGSVTQRSILASRQQPNARLADRDHYRRKIGQTWAERKGMQLRNKARVAWWVLTERLWYGHSLKERRLEGKWRYS